MKLFEFAIIQHPTAKETEEGGQSKIVVPPTAVLAPNEQAAAMIAGRSIPESLVGMLDRLEVAVRPF